MMESPPPLSRYVPQTPSKRVLTGSSSACMEDEVVEIPPPANRRSKRVVQKQEEVLLPEIIDVDLDDCPDMLLFEKEVDKSGKGKEVIANFSPGSGIDHGTGEVALGPEYLYDGDDLMGDFLYGENEVLYEENGYDILHDDYFYDEQYAILQSHLDSLNIPPGVEVPVPWFSEHQENELKSTATTTPNLSTTPMELDQTWDGSISVNSSHVEEKSKEIGHYKKWEPSSSGLFDGFVQLRKKATTSSSVNTRKESLYLSPNTKLPKSLNHFAQTSGVSSKVPYGIPGSGFFNSYNDYSTRKRFGDGGAHHAYSHKQAKQDLLVQAGGANAVNLPDMPKNIPSFLTAVYKPGFITSSDFVHTYPFSTATAPASSTGPFYGKEKYGVPGEFLKKFEAFKRFDVVDDFSDHHYSKNDSSMKQPPREWAKKIQEEWRILEEHLPETIFVRVYESRMDLLRAVMIGAEGTPYHDGLFFFDVFFPSSYPSVPPLVHYQSRGHRINPNLYNSGKVCLSLLNTWSGSGKEKWIPKQSTILQVLVSIQGLILNSKPYFNEPGYAGMSGTPEGEKLSLQYNENTFILSLKTMVCSIRNPPKYFEDFVAGHFFRHAREILVACKSYIDGAQVGCLVKGGVQDLEQGDTSCSENFKNQLAGYITTLVEAFKAVSVNDCDEFLSLAQKTTAGNNTGPGKYSRVYGSYFPPYPEYFDNQFAS